MIVLVTCTYKCTFGHQIIGTDPRLLIQLPQHEFIPFVLFHRSGVTRRFARSMISLLIEGLSICAVERLVKSYRNDFIASLQLKLNYILPFIEFEGETSIKDASSVAFIHKPHPSNDLIHSCFLNNFLRSGKCTFE